jgi:hypothetical protein
LEIYVITKVEEIIHRHETNKGSIDHASPKSNNEPIKRSKTIGINPFQKIEECYFLGLPFSFLAATAGASPGAR